MYSIKRIQKVPISLEQAWDFFSSPKNLAVITPPDLGFVIHSGLPEKMYAGMFIEYTVRPLFGIPMNWVTEITHVAEHDFFVDEQRVGPYKIWHHQHFFRPIAGGTEVEDIVHYQLPLGPFGKMGHGILVRPRLEAIFEYRQQKLVELFGAFEGQVEKV